MKYAWIGDDVNHTLRFVVDRLHAQELRRGELFLAPDRPFFVTAATSPMRPCDAFFPPRLDGVARPPYVNYFVSVNGRALAILDSSHRRSIERILPLKSAGSAKYG